MPDSRVTNATVVVLGDLERSPRMRYHAETLAVNGVQVDLVGYATGPVTLPGAPEGSICVHGLRSLEPPWRRMPRVVYLPLGLLRVFGLAVQLGFVLLFRVARPDLIIVQNPPALPTLPVAWLAARLRRGQTAVDWHNLGWTALANRVGGAERREVRWLRRLEGIFARRADLHLCVSAVLRDELRQRWGLRDVQVLPDRPTAGFVPTPAADRQALLTRLGLVPQASAGSARRSALVLSPTSWNEDEDYGLLLDAVSLWEDRVRRHDAEHPEAPHPAVTLAVTGRGPLREDFERRMRRLPQRRIEVRTLWVVEEDYPRLVGAADLGLSLHHSSSGLDLPIKIADFFGAGVPVCAFDYAPVLGEALRAGENGVLFRNARELADRLFELFHDFPAESSRLQTMRSRLAHSPEPRWHDGWNQVLGPLVGVSSPAFVNRGPS